VVFCLPPFPHSGIIYLNLAKHNLHGNLKFISFDIPGWVGNSENIFEENDFDILEIIGICQTIVDHMNVKKFNLLRYSFGTSIEALFAALSEERLKKLIFVSPVVNAKAEIGDRRVRLVKGIYPFRPGSLLKRYVVNRYKYIYCPVMIKNGMPMEMIEE